MVYQLSGYTLLYLAASCVSAVAAIFVFRNRRAPGGWWLFLMTLATAVWSLADAFDYSSVTLSSHVTAARFAYLGSTSPVLFLLFALQYSGRVRRPMRWSAAALFVVPLISIVAAFTNQVHHLVWPGFTMVPGQPNIILYQHGPVYWVVALYSLALALLATLLLVDAAVRARGIYRSQGAAMVIAAIFPWLAGIAYSLFPASFIGLDPALTFTVTGAILAWTVWRLKLLDLVHIPREVLVEEMTDGLLVLDSAARILEINPAAARMLGLAKAPVPGTLAIEAFADWSQAGKDAVVAVYGERKSTLASPTGAFIGVERSRLAGCAEGQPRDLFILHDITCQVEAEQALHRAYEDLSARMGEIEGLHEELREQAMRDPLTGLHNRRYLAEELERELGRADRDAHRVSVIMLDVDGFKDVNDTYGHAVGDEMLCAIAAELLEGTRSSDITCRYGGDEFVVVLPNAGSNSALTRAEAWRVRFAEIMAGIGDQRVNATVSLGVATFPEDASTMDALVAAADRAVYASKAAGRDRSSKAATAPEEETVT